MFATFSKNTWQQTLNLPQLNCNKPLGKRAFHPRCSAWLWFDVYLVSSWGQQVQHPLTQRAELKFLKRSHA